MSQAGASSQAVDSIADVLDRIAAVDVEAVLARLLPGLLRVALILALALGAYRGVRLLSRRLEREIEEEDPLVKRAREQRARTLASLLDNIGLVAIVTVTAITLLGTFGVRIEALLASVGILGLAVSFGAQSLVRDVISGAFILLEGQFGIGDVIRVGDISGAVEKITLRTTILRDVRGVLHIVPNGEITRISNMTKAWSRAVLDVRVAYHEDVDRVIAILEDVGAELRRDPDWSAIVTENPTVPGVEDFAESGIVIRMVATTLPLKQWEVARELRRRIKKRFDAEGITIPFPHVTVYWGDRQMSQSVGPEEH